MKILLVQETDWFKRGPHQQHHLAELLSLRGHEIRVIDYELLWKAEGRKGIRSRRQVFNDVSKIHDGAGVTVIRPSIIKISVLNYISLIFSHKKEIQRQIVEFSPDVIVGLGILNAYLSMMISRNTTIPFIYYWLDVLDTLVPDRLFRSLARQIERKTLKSTDKVLVINDRLKDHVVELGASSERTEVLGAGIDLARYNLDTDGTAIRRQFNISEDDIVIFFMGVLYDFSGLKEVALQLAKDRIPNLKFLIVGDGDAYSDIQEIREKHGLHDHIILTGQKPYSEIPSHISASDICVLPAYNNKTMRDIVPIKMYEYMAMKKPVISTRLPGVMMEFKDTNGVVYVDKPEDVVVKARELAANGSLNELGVQARRFVERNSWENIADEFERILTKIIEEKTK